MNATTTLMKPHNLLWLDSKRKHNTKDQTIHHEFDWQNIIFHTHETHKILYHTLFVSLYKTKKKNKKRDCLIVIVQLRNRKAHPSQFRESKKNYTSLVSILNKKKLNVIVDGFFGTTFLSSKNGVSEFEIASKL